MKTAISIPNEVFSHAEQLARRLNMSRSQLYTQAIEKFVDERAYFKVKEKLDAIYTTETSRLDPAFLRAQTGSLGEENW